MSVCDFCFFFLFQCCQLLHSPSDAVKVGVSGHEIKKRIIIISGPVVTARGVYTSFSSRNRPSAQNVQLCMEDLEKEGLGIFKKVDKLKVFYKKLPGDDIKPKLSLYEMSLESYTAIFRKGDPRLTTRNRDEIWEHHPDAAAVDAYLLPPAPVASQK